MIYKLHRQITLNTRTVWKISLIGKEEADKYTYKQKVNELG